MRNIAVPFLIWSAVNASGASTDLAATLSETTCAPQLRKTVGPWLERQTWFPQVISIPGLPLQYGSAFRDSRTQKAYQVWSDDRKGAHLITSDLRSGRETRYVWNAKKNCELNRTEEPIPPPPTVRADGYSDSDLEKTINSHSWGIIYVWTPYMPLSVDGLKDIKAAVQARGGHLTVLVDGKANPSEIRTWVEKGEVQQSETTPVASQELYAREMGLHYPIAFIYKDKFISNRTYIGHKAPNVYERWIDIELGNIKKDLQ